jgi:hypothetical protein
MYDSSLRFDTQLFGKDAPNYRLVLDANDPESGKMVRVVDSRVRDLEPLEVGELFKPGTAGKLSVAVVSSSVITRAPNIAVG